MSERPFTPPGDDDLDAALRARRRLVPKFDTHLDDEPPPELDRLVLSRAREALRLESPPERHFRGPRWAVPVSIAATVLLSLGLVLQMDPSRNDAVLATGGNATATTATTAMTTPERADAAASGAAADAASDAAATSPPPAPALQAAPEAAPARAAERAVADAPAFAPAPSPVSAPMNAPAPAPEPPPAPAPAPASSSAYQDTDATAERDLGESTLRAGAQAALRKQAAPSTAGAASRRAAPREEAAAASADEAPGDAARGAIPRDDPQRWLDAILRLQRLGELDAARAELSAFRLRYPGQPVPGSLDTLR